MKTILKKILSKILKLESQLVLWKYKPKIVAITGSVGKTSTKDAIYASISSNFYVRKSEKSYNSEIGLPLTILGCSNGWNSASVWIKNIFKGFWLFVWPHKYPEWLILEVGIGKKGDMKKTASWIKSDVVVMTAIGDTPSHIEFFSGRDDLVREKSELIKTLKKSGFLILNADDATIMEMKTKTKNAVFTYGFDKDANISASEYNIFYNNKKIPEGIIFRVDNMGSSFPVVIENVFGKNHIYASLAALAFCFSQKFNMLDAVSSLKNYDVPQGRMRLISGISDSIIIDDTYNSSPFACESGLNTLGEIKTEGRKISVLGDMLELGKHTKEAHEKVGRVAKENSDILVVVGQRAQDIKHGAIDAGMDTKNIFEFSNSIEAGEFLKTLVQKNDVFFIKGSQGMRMERAVLAVLLDKENKERLLVRQDKEWIAKK